VRFHWLRRLLLILLVAGLGAPRPARAQAPRRDYLSEVEADKIRDAQNPNDRIKLFLDFAADRLKKFQYELGRANSQSRRAEILNGLLNAYTGCIDDAADLITLAKEKQADIRPALKDMQSRGKGFLETLEKLTKDEPELEVYKETLDDAMDGTRDALKDAEKALQEMAPPPVRRKP
jgi:chromosome segregation ATPase